MREYFAENMPWQPSLSFPHHVGQGTLVRNSK